MWKLLRLAALIAMTMQTATGWAQDSALMVRGKYLMKSVVACGNCHVARSSKGEPLFSKGLSGGMLFEDPAFKAYAPNITPDTKTGIGTWTDAQLGKAIRDGIRPDGSVIGPPMPIYFYRNLSDSDLAAIIAYLKAQPAVQNVVEKSTYHMPLPTSYGPPVGHVSTPASTDTLLYGEYLSNIGHCMDCHTPRNNKGMLVLAKLGAGGQAIQGPGGEVITPNLTPAPSGLKSWSDKEIDHAIRTGISKDGSHLQPVMAFDWYKNISNPDMAAIIAYLRALKPEPFGGK
ncbi:c-type cytochrome [Pusillimonas sp. ANT_WB101]|uniref:c-type cytochrome n=1 Tax=Pusillimonas sp. ANT_WB101 TaxID=2597356 RepID=UPI0011EFDEA8|nr:c-type cytochrome [Pusillimonas sp. ANT_WB101]KAA0911489.1 cytochrome c [Pusillimonas sp. ANT_WB101]